MYTFENIPCVFCRTCEHYENTPTTTAPHKCWNNPPYTSPLAEMYGNATANNCKNFKEKVSKGISDSSSGGGAGLAGSAAVGGLAIGAGGGIVKILLLPFKLIFLLYKYLFIGFIFLWKKFAVPPFKRYASNRRQKINTLDQAVDGVFFDTDDSITPSTICEELDGLISDYDELRKARMHWGLMVFTVVLFFYPLLGLPYFFKKEPGISKTKALKKLFGKIDEGVQQLGMKGDTSNAERYQKDVKKMRLNRKLQFVIPIGIVVVFYAAIYFGLNLYLKSVL
ncbi:hypothetical protein AGMMS50267_10830 [Spirochaetia bacterium]|nr:hypothetical protein AGMMS50267_10830 [Spirochaetia bacterium]